MPAIYAIHSPIPGHLLEVVAEVRERDAPKIEVVDWAAPPVRIISSRLDLPRESAPMNCSHDCYRTSQPRPYSNPVSRDENPCAHGWIYETHTCVGCDAIRLANRNQQHEELGAWGPSPASPRRQVRHEDPRRERAEDLRRARNARQCESRLDSLRVKVLSVDGRDVWVGMDEEIRYASREQIALGADQPDDGDGLVPLYQDVQAVLEGIDAGVISPRGHGNR